MKKIRWICSILFTLAILVIGSNTLASAPVSHPSLDIPAAGPLAPAAPTNDDFANGTTLAGDFGTLIGETNVDASAETGEPNHAGVPGTPARSVWYQWTPSVDGNTVVEVTTAPYTFDTYIVLAVYTGSAVNTLTEVAAGGDDAFFRTVELEFRVEAGTTYHLAVDGRDSDKTGGLDLSWSIPSPANDDFADATLLVGNSGTVVGESNEWATAEISEPNHAGLAGTPVRSVWYEWTPSIEGTAVFTVTTPLIPNDWNSALAVYTGATLVTLSEVAADSTTGYSAEVAFYVAPGMTYFVAVDGYDAEEFGDFDLSWAVKLAPPNDNFADATTLASEGGSLTGESNQWATAEAGEPSHAGDPDTPTRSVWYEWTPTVNGDAYVEMTTQPYSAQLIVAAVYTGSAVDALTEVVSKGPIRDSYVEFGAQAGTTYHIVIDSADSDQVGDFDLAWTIDDGIYTVTKTEDTNDGACDEDCSLREAAEAADALFSVDATIHLPAGTYTLTLWQEGGLGFDREDFTTRIIGAGRDVTVVDASGLVLNPGDLWRQARAFYLDYHSGLELDGITITGGYFNQGSPKHGAGILSWNGYLTVSDCLIEGNVSGENGGGIANLYGTAVISNTIIRNNNTDPPEYTTTGYGGGIFNSGTMTITGSLLENNASDYGGGIASEYWLLEDYVPALTVIDSTITENSAQHGAGIANLESMPDVPGREATLRIEDSRIVDNHADRSQYGFGAFNEGGGVFNRGYSAATIISSSVISGNLVTAIHAFHPKDGSGGGVHNHGGRVEVWDTTISGNQTICDQVVNGDPDLCGRGGGILNTGAGRMIVTNSTISSNYTTLLNTDHGSYLGGGGGGGLAHMPFCDPPYCWCPATAIINTTITGNTADHGGGLDTRWESWGAGIYDVPDWEVSPGSDIYECAGLQVLNSIVAANDATFTSGTEDCWGEYTSFGYNLVGIGTGCPSDGPGDIVTTNPLLMPLGDYGGPTETHALLLGSAAIDGGDPAGCTDFWGAPLTIDQRGFTRPVGLTCDIGAFEAPEPLRLFLPLTIR